MEKELTNNEKELLKKITDKEEFTEGAYNIRKNGEGFVRKTTENVDIVSKKDKPGIDIIVKENTKNEFIHIPVMITESGVNDLVYNDFYIGKNAEVTIIAGCGIHNDKHMLSRHDGIHSFYLEEGAKVKYVEKHYGQGEGTGEKILNPKTVVNLKKGATLEMDSVQIEGVDSTIRETFGELEEDSNFIVSEKIMTHGKQYAKTVFNVKLNGKNASTHVISRSVAKENSKQEFFSNVEGNTECYGHVECDAIIMDNGTVKAVPEILANDVDARLIHEAAIGKIAGEQLTKLMTLGLSEKEAEAKIVSGFLK
ncbi:MAG: SufD family Fe-S cluster assembly protein [Clostridia bacterium]|nr:SufD family Fe-S cluster assembly protein [Clostridia bacterium]